MKGYVYTILNVVTLNFYIGGSSSYKLRVKRHFDELRRNSHHSVIFQREYNFWGEECFISFIIDVAEDKSKQEQMRLNAFNFGYMYNVSRDAVAGNTLYNHPNRNAIIKKVIKAGTENLKLANRSHPGESNPNWRGGKEVTMKRCPNCGKYIQKHYATCSKCRDRSGDKNPFFGKIHSEETKEKLRNSNLGKVNECQEKKISINGIVYRSLSEAARQLNENASKLAFRAKSKNVKFKDYFYINV